VYLRAIREESASISVPRSGSGGAGGDYTSYSGSSNFYVMSLESIRMRVKGNF
jgi:hypothetical protein